MPSGTILVINCGSSSIKFALVNPDAQAFALSGLAERLGSPDAVLHWQAAGQKHTRAIATADHRAALAQLLPLVQQAAGEQLLGIGHRVVHGGEHFTSASLINPQTLAAIRQTAPLAPLHNPANLQGIEAALALFPELPQVAVFDTAFHQSLPEHAYRYALPEVLYREHGVRRYGFHGTSHRYVSLRAAELSGLPVTDSSWLSAHLGNGCSTCAIVNGQSRDTSMGLTPLEGLAMGTRSGDVDPNLFGHLSRTLDWSLEQIEHMLNHDSGLLGLSGLSNDMRSLEQARAKGHPGATLAIEVFCYRLAKSLAAMGCALPRLDGLIFTGGIGENSALVRSKTLEHLQLLNLRLDPAANLACVGGNSGPIELQGHTRVLVIATNEERQIALDTLAAINTVALPN
ncbi:MAG: acetate kinase [Pseudomonas sp.]|uniref:acetate kinase n=1 Tax=Pseudomonas sp. TaxID=306 RepID=UPI002736A1F4|nr:acetate kinase [Pseudomonas sp.]MDP3847383.1 acetate kinase [Pseudomonas sp.]